MLRKWLEEASAQLNMFDGGKTAASVRAGRQAAQLPSSVQNNIRNARYGVLANNRNAQNEFLRGESTEQIKRNEEMRRLQQEALQNSISKNLAAAKIKNIANDGVVQANEASNTLKVNNRAANVGLGATMGVGRSLAGTAEGISGLYDLATPGTGQNRFGKRAQQFGEQTDQFVDQFGISKGAYKGGQFGTEMATFYAAGAPLIKGTAKAGAVASKLPGAGKVAAATTRLADSGRVGNAAVRVGRYLGRPDIAADIIADTALSTGLRSNRGGDISPTSMLVDAGMSAGAALGFGAVGKGALAVADPVLDTMRTRGLARPAALSPREVQDLANFQKFAQTDGMMDDATYKAGKKAAAKAGIDYTDSNAVNNLLDSFLNYNTKRTNLKEGVKRLASKPTPLDEAGAVSGDSPLLPLNRAISKAQNSEKALTKQYDKLIQQREFATSKEARDVINTKLDEVVGKLDTIRQEKTFAKVQAQRAQKSPSRRNQLERASDYARKLLGDESGAVSGDSPLLPVNRAVAKQQAKKAAKQSAQLPEQTIIQKTSRSSGDSIPPFEQDLADAGLAPKKSRFANKTVQESDEVSAPLKKLVKDEKVSYIPTTNKGRIDEADKFLKGKSNEKAFTEVIKRFDNPKGTTDQDIVNGIQLAKKLDASGKEDDLFKATELFDSLSRTLTEKGQAVQAASLLSNRTPQGLMYTAQKNLRKGGVDIDANVQKELKGMVDAIKQQTPGTYEDGLARYKLMEYVSKKTPSRRLSKALQVWKAGLLSAPRTTAGNIAANTAESVFKKGYVDPVASAIDGLISLFPGMKRSRSLTVRGMASGFGEGAGKGVKYFKTGYDPRRPLEKFDIRDIHFSDTKAGRAAEKYTQGIFRLMGAQDQPFYYANLRNSLADQAITAAKNQKLKGTSRDAFVKKFITEPSKEAMELADKEARYAVFQNETALGKAASKLKGAGGATGDVAEFVMPFSGVPSSIATRMIERTPIGTASEVVKQIRSKSYNQRKLTEAIANGSAVIPMLGVGKALAESGQITLGTPSDQKERDLWELEGKQPYSIKIGNTWHSMNYFQPAGTLIAAGAEYAKKIKDGAKADEAISTALAGAGKALTEQSFLKGVSGVINAINDPQRFGERFAEQTAGSAIPNILRSVANSTDSVKREQKGVVEAVKGGIPGIRQTLDARTNIFGQEVPRQTDALSAFISPTRPSDELEQEAITQELRRLQDAGEGTTTGKLTNSKDLKFTDQQKRDFEKATGAAIKKEWDTIIKDPRYQQLDDEKKKQTLRSASEAINTAYKQKLMAENNIGQYAPDYDGKKTKLSGKERRVLNGEQVDWLSGARGKNNSFVEEYEDKLASYRAEKGTMSRVEQRKVEKEIRQLSVKKDFDKDTVDLYGMSKSEVYDFLSNDPEGNALAKKLLAYDDALVAAGLRDKNKFRDKNGNEAIRPKDGGGGGGGRKRGINDFSLYGGGDAGSVALNMSKTLQKLLAGAKI